MAKKLKAMVKLQIPAGKANPAPPVGTALGPHGVNIMGFLQGVQRANPEPNGPDHSGRNLHIHGRFVYVYHQDAAGCRSDQESRQVEQRQLRAEQGQSWLL